MLLECSSLHQNVIHYDVVTPESTQNLMHLQLENLRADIYAHRESLITTSPKRCDKRRQWHALFVQRNLVETIVGI